MVLLWLAPIGASWRDHVVGFLPCFSRPDTYPPSMLQESDLEAFVQLVHRAERETPLPGFSPDTLLRPMAGSNDLLADCELRRLRNSLEMASILGGVSDYPHQILDIIIQGVVTEKNGFLPFSHERQWLNVISWAFSQQSSQSHNELFDTKQKRQLVVGKACKALRDRGYNVNINAFGPSIDAETGIKIAQRIDKLFKHIGGAIIVNRLCQVVCESGNLHAGMWLLGNKVPNTGDSQTPDPAVPLGWLISIALRHTHVNSSPTDIAKSWKEAIQLAVDFAASLDCQWYTPFEGMFIGAQDFPFAIGKSLLWREFFTLPQVPSVVLPTIRLAFSQVTWPSEASDLKSDVDNLFDELEKLLDMITFDRPRILSILQVHSCFPLLCRYGWGYQGDVNPMYLGIPDENSDKNFRNHDQLVFFPYNNEYVFVLPRALTAAAGCSAIFKMIRGRGEKSVVDKIISKTIEKSIAISCKKHRSLVQENLSYCVNGKQLEFDVAIRENQEIILFETKAKSLTSKARTFNVMEFVSDYTKSFLSMLRQIVRHELNIKRGQTPLTKPGEDPRRLCITKVAVSPLCYGPLSDHLLIRSFFSSMLSSKLYSTTGNSKDNVAANVFNEKMSSVIKDIGEICKIDNQILDNPTDLNSYFIDIFWLDLGQLIYLLERGCSIADSFSPLKHITFSTRDFWTEAFYAESMGLTNGKWLSFRVDNPSLRAPLNKTSGGSKMEG